MRISHTHKFVFLSNPRCGSVSIRKLLDPYSDIQSTKVRPYYHHISAEDLKSHFDDMKWNWDEYTKFTTIRNPWSRMLSAYKYGQINQNSIWHRIGREAGSFKNFIHHPETFDEKRALKSIDRFAFDQSGKCLMDYIIKLEDIDIELPKILEKISINKKRVPYINRSIKENKWKTYIFFYINTNILGRIKTSKRKPPTDTSYRIYYGEEEKRKIEGVFYSDINLGKYKF